MNKILKDILSLDIYDLNFIYGSEGMNILSSAPSRLPKKGLVVRLGSFFVQTLKNIGNLGYLVTNESVQPRSILFFVTSKNQRDSLAYLESTNNDMRFVGGNPRFAVNVSEKFPYHLSYAISVFFLPLIFYKFLKAKAYRKKTFYYIADQYLHTYGFYIVAKSWLDRLRPRALVISNDHNMANRAIAKAAKERGILTFYVQHASVTEKFPPLSFDYAFLEGKDALSKYECAGASSTKVFLIGMPKADAYSSYQNTNQSVQVAGICTNNLDPPDKVDHLCESLHDQFPTLRFLLRPHPGDKRLPGWIKLSKKYEMEFSDSRIVSSLDFLSQVDAIIAGDSNILLEAALFNVYPIYYDFAKTNLDWYGFARNGLVQYFCEPEEVINQIIRLKRSKPYIRDRAKIYCATIGTSYDGRSAELASALVKQLVNGGGINKTIWTRVPGSKLQAYQLNPTSSGDQALIQK